MKKRIVCMLALAMTISVAGCGSTGQAPTDAPASEDTAAEETDQPKEQEAADDTADAETEDTSAEAEDYNYYVEIPENLTMDEIRTANSPITLMKDHESLGFTWENYDANDTLRSTMQAQYIMFEGKLWYDAVLTDENGLKSYYSDYEADDVPGATYNYQEGVDDLANSMTLYPKEEYQYWCAQRWMPDLYPGQEEEITDISTQDGALLVQVRTTYTDFGNYHDTLFYLRPETYLILYREDTWYDEEDNLLSVDKYTPVYDEPHVSDQVAKGMVSDSAEDVCDLTVVFNPNKENMETQEFKIAKGTIVNVISNSNYTLYSSDSCTSNDMIDTIDTDKDESVIYVLLED